MTISTPDWVKHAVFYQIFPDRFAKSTRMNHPRGLHFKPWGSPPEEQGYQGGDLYGIVDKLDYLKDLGITVLYLNPIFSSASNHRYHTFDFMEVDPLLGGEAGLRELIDEAHARDIKIVLDGVFNHASRGFWPFHHILENGKNSPYIDWFNIHDLPLRPYSSNDKNPLNYDAWWGMPALPKLNTNNPGVRDHIFEIAKYWIDFGVDGWRLDVPTEINDDDFWREFRHVVKSSNPDAYICGEIWHEARHWLQGDMFDSVMNYIFTWVTLSFFGGRTIRSDFHHDHLPVRSIDAGEFAREINHMLGLYDWQINLVQLNLLDSHDMARALWIVGEDVDALKLSALFQMTMPGAPCIYYGDEIGMTAAGDPHCRGAYPWHDDSLIDLDLHEFYKNIIAMRHQHPVLRTGSFEHVFARGDVYCFRRKLEDDAAIVVFNNVKNSPPLTLREGGEWEQIWPLQGDYARKLDDERLEITLPDREAVVLIRKSE